MTSLDAKFEQLLHSPKQELLNSMQASSEGEVMKQPASRHYGFARPAVVDLKRKSVIGGIAAVSAQGVKFFLRLQVLGKSPADFYLRLNKRIWQRLPFRVRNLYPVRCYGAWLHTLICLRASRQQCFGTFFLRNRPALELMCRLAQQKDYASTLRIAVLGCSIGAEVYSILWTLRLARPDLKIVLSAIDNSKEMLTLAEKGTYSPNISELVGAQIFERLTAYDKRQCLIGKAIRPRSNRGLGKGSSGGSVMLPIRS